MDYELSLKRRNCIIVVLIIIIAACLMVINAKVIAGKERITFYSIREPGQEPRVAVGSSAVGATFTMESIELTLSRVERGSEGNTDRLMFATTAEDPDELLDSGICKRISLQYPDGTCAAPSRICAFSEDVILMLDFPHREDINEAYLVLRCNDPLWLIPIGSGEAAELPAEEHDGSVHFALPADPYVMPEAEKL